MSAGVLLLIAGVVNILTGVAFMSYTGVTPVEFEYCGAILAIMGILALPAWVFCMQRSHFAYCIAAAAITLFSIGPFFLSSLLGIVALVLIAVSHEEFR